MASKSNTIYPTLTEKTPQGWVYILYNSLSKEIRIGSSFDAAKRICNPAPNERLVYYRSFSNPFDALAHKHMLEYLSKESVMHHILKQNPALSHLGDEIENTNT
ncbi:MAG: hypothetical protein RBR35_05585 [Salinivirgaceae bacterium]|nr:hypothetical protein [Salinivirgaceae bacterium]